jgi:hypothetical protein
MIIDSIDSTWDLVSPSPLAQPTKIKPSETAAIDNVLKQKMLIKKLPTNIFENVFHFFSV